MRSVKVLIVALVLVLVCSSVFAASVEDYKQYLQGTNSVATSAAASSSYIGSFGSATTAPSVVTMSTEDYLVTAGDVYSLAFWANNSAVTYNIVVDPTYRIRVANLGIVDATGMTFLELKEKVEEIVTANYPMSGVQFLISSPGTFKVTIKGEVPSTTVKTLSGLVRLSDVVSGQGTKYASNRLVKVVDVNGVEKSYDLFLATRFGDMSQNPYVRPDDTITICRYERKVSITGLVERPGEYELLAGENLITLINYYAGGLDPLADKDKIKLVRSITGEHSAEKTIYLASSVLSADYELVNYDTVDVSSLKSLKNSIFVQGAVAVSIADTVAGNASTQNLRYDFSEGEYYTDFVRRNKDLFSDVSDYDNAYILRAGQKLSIDLYDMLFDPDYESSLTLEAFDILVIPFKQFFVTVTGAVKIPGRYSYVPDRTWDYYVGLAGGLDEELNAKDEVEIRDAAGNELTKDDLITPETTINALKNSGIYKFNKIMTPIATVLSVITSALLTVTYVKGL